MGWVTFTRSLPPNPGHFYSSEIIKPHETTGRAPQEAWEEEKPHLQPLARTPFRAQPAVRTQQVYQDGLVKVLGNRTSVPASHHGRDVKVRVAEEKVEFTTLEGEGLWTYWRSLGKGKRFKVPAHYAKQYRVPTEQLTARLLSLYQDPELIEQLKKNFPRHDREQSQQMIALAQHFDLRVLQQAIQRLIQRGCLSYGNLKTTARYLESQETLSKALRSGVDLEAELPTDLGLEVRSTDYYDHVVEVEQ